MLQGSCAVDTECSIQTECRGKKTKQSFWFRYFFYPYQSHESRVSSPGGCAMLPEVPHCHPFKEWFLLQVLQLGLELGPCNQGVAILGMRFCPYLHSS